MAWQVRLMVLSLVMALAVVMAGVPPAATAAGVIVQIDNPSQGEQNMSPPWIAGWAARWTSAATHGVPAKPSWSSGSGSARRGRSARPAR